jgi:hypothetical protein
MLGTYRIIVSEPWDYEGIFGKNLIVGSILRKVGDTCIIFKSATPLDFKGKVGDKLVLFPRTKDTNFNDVDLGVMVNAGLLMSDNFEFLDEKGLENQSYFAVIGELKKM